MNRTVPPHVSQPSQGRPGRSALPGPEEPEQSPGLPRGGCPAPASPRARFYLLPSLGSAETIPTPRSSGSCSCIFYLRIPEALIRAGAQSSYSLLEFSCVMSLGSNNVFYRKTKIRGNLALHCLTDHSAPGGWGWLLLFWFFLPFFMDKQFMGQKL